MLVDHLLSPQQGAVHPAQIPITFSGCYSHSNFWTVPIICDWWKPRSPREARRLGGAFEGLLFVFFKSITFFLKLLLTHQHWGFLRKALIPDFVMKQLFPKSILVLFVSNLTVARFLYFLIWACSTSPLLLLLYQNSTYWSQLAMSSLWLWTLHKYSRGNPEFLEITVRLDIDFHKAHCMIHNLLTVK